MFIKCATCAALFAENSHIYYLPSCTADHVSVTGEGVIDSPSGTLLSSHIIAYGKANVTYRVFYFVIFLVFEIVNVFLYRVFV